jgi:hypothetical protein
VKRQSKSQIKLKIAKIIAGKAFIVQYPIYSTVNLEIYGIGFQPYFCA